MTTPRCSTTGCQAAAVAEILRTDRSPFLPPLYGCQTFVRDCGQPTRRLTPADLQAPRSGGDPSLPGVRIAVGIERPDVGSSGVGRSGPAGSLGAAGRALVVLILAVALVGVSPAPATASTSVRGIASFYCWPGWSRCTRGHHWTGAYAAAGPALRVGNWRGRIVNVCATHATPGASSMVCLRVKLVDFCRCDGGRVIDVYGNSFRKLAPLSRGLVRVTVSW